MDLKGEQPSFIDPLRLPGFYSLEYCCTFIRLHSVKFPCAIPNLVVLILHLINNVLIFSAISTANFHFKCTENE